jgi:hypothetical protein
MDHDEKRARYDGGSPSDQSTKKPDAGPSAASSPLTSSTGYFPHEGRRSSLTLPGVAELSLLSGHAATQRASVSGKLPPLSDYTGQATGQSSHSGREANKYPPFSGELDQTPQTGATADELRVQRLSLPHPPMSGAPPSPTGFLPTTSSYAARTVTSPPTTAGPVSPPVSTSSLSGGATATSSNHQHRFPNAMRRLVLRNPATDGCGNCEEGGSCPCVDTLVNVEDDDESERSGGVLYTEIK